MKISGSCQTDATNMRLSGGRVFIEPRRSTPNQGEYRDMAQPRTEEKISQQEARQERAAQSAQNATQTVSDVTGRIARTAADVSARAARTGADLAQRNREGMQQIFESAAEMASHFVEVSADQFNRMLGFSGDEVEKAAQQSSDKVESVLQSTNAIASKSREFSREWFDMSRKLMGENISRSEDLLRCKSPQELFSIQADLAHKNLNVLLQSARRFSEMSARAVDEATRKMSDTARQAA
jgi:phasin family protein